MEHRFQLKRMMNSIIKLFYFCMRDSVKVRNGFGDTYGIDSIVLMFLCTFAEMIDKNIML